MFGRRVGKIVDEGTPSAVGSYYFYLGDRMVEEKNDAGTKMASYLYGQYIDDALAVVRNVNGTQTGFVYETDDQYNVLAVTDNAGNVVERYDYDAFGKPTIYAPDFTVRQTSAIGNTLMFNGRVYDPETGFYYYRTRYLDPRAGRFTTRDSIGIWGDPANLGNGYAYVGNNPVNLLDPMGLGLQTLIMTGVWDSPVPASAIRGAYAQGFAEGARGGASIVVNTATLGRSDARGITNSWQYQGGAYGASRVFAGVGTAAVGGVAVVAMAPAAGSIYSAAYVAAANPDNVVLAIAGAEMFAAPGTPSLAPMGVLSNANYAQKTFCEKFTGKDSRFFGKTIDEIAAALRAGELTPADVPIDYIIREGNTLMLNTRSTQALIRAGISRELWNAVNRTGQQLYESMLTGQLTRNNLTSQGISVVRSTGGN